MDSHRRVFVACYLLLFLLSPHSSSADRSPCRSTVPQKRTRRASPGPSGLSAGERLKRAKLTGNASYFAWGWVGTEVSDTSGITNEHRLATCGFSRNSSDTLCPNKSVEKRKASSPPRVNGHTDTQAGEELADDVIGISDDEGPTCSTKSCKPNPYCLNYLGQDKWENAGESSRGCERCFSKC